MKKNVFISMCILITSFVLTGCKEDIKPYQNLGQYDTIYDCSKLLVRKEYGGEPNISDVNTSFYINNARGMAIFINADGQKYYSKYYTRSTLKNGQTINIFEGINNGPTFAFGVSKNGFIINNNLNHWFECEIR